MPRPIFDINEYELRGTEPQVFTKAQQDRLNKTLSRVQGQIDWSAQLLGFNGTNYWGRANPKEDFSYNWTGLPETMSEKRQMQVGAYGVYNKDKTYDLWPAPFNRSLVKASGDFKFHIFEQDGLTYLSPIGQGEGINFSEDQVVFVGGSYIFDSAIEILPVGGEVDDAVTTSEFFVSDQTWTRVDILDTRETLVVKIKDSEAKNAIVTVLPWEDISDWNFKHVTDQYLGLWGNKGNQLSMDFAFDSLDLHGYDETYGLTFDDTPTVLTVDELMGSVGLEPTEWTSFYFNEFKFSVGENCTLGEALPPFLPDELYDNGGFSPAVPPVDLLDGGVIDGAAALDLVDEGTYERIYEADEYLEDNYEFLKCTSDCNYTLTATQQLEEESSDPTVLRGIASFTFDFKPEAQCAVFDYPCVEWVFDPTLDDGEYDRLTTPTSGPWATANEGEYDRVIQLENVTQGTDKCDSARFFSFDDGLYDPPIGSSCDAAPTIDEPCDEIDGFLYTVFGTPDYDDCSCAIECCLVDNELYIPGGDPAAYVGPFEIVDGGIISETCIIYDNQEYSRDPTLFTCQLDNGTLESATAPTDTVDESIFDREYDDCITCEEDQSGDIPFCTPDPIRVGLSKIFEDLLFKMQPTVRNSLVPLSVWKNHPLTVTDQVPFANTQQYNFLVADENRGCEPEDSFRYFVRLPLEYTRNGKEWNRALSVCNNQGYFSVPPTLSDTQVNPVQPRPLLYDETYWRTDLEENSTFYQEDFLVSTIRENSETEQDFFTASSITFEEEVPLIYFFAQITNYDPYVLRTPEFTGEWKGVYLQYGSYSPFRLRTGYLTTDLEKSRVIQVDPPVYDESVLKRPNVEFPDEPDQVAMKNYVVSYAYFVADFSSADEPVFEPEDEYCWRRTSLECIESVGSECVSSIVETNTAYRLHDYSLTS